MDVELDFEIGAIPAEPHSSPLSRQLASDRQSILQSIHADLEARISETQQSHGERLDALLMLVSVGGDALDWAVAHINGTLGDDDEDHTFAHYYETLAVLAERALTTTAEIYHLLRVNLIPGARARLRTLEEIFLVTTVLAVHGYPGGEYPDLITRYREHHRVFARGLAEELLNSGIVDPVDVLDADKLQELENVRVELVGKYGKSYQTLWGWAAGLFPPNTRITFGKLSKLIDVDLAAFNSLASRQVHASSEGWHEAQEQDSGFDFDYVAAMCSGYLHLTLQAVVPVSSTSKDNDVDAAGHDWQAALYTLVLEVRGTPAD